MDRIAAAMARNALAKSERRWARVTHAKQKDAHVNTLHCTPHQLDVLRHMMGINDSYQATPRPYRNYAAVCPADPCYAEMVQAGLVERYGTATGPDDYDYYRCTEAGKTAAMASHKAIRLSKPKRMYAKFLALSDVFPDLQFRDFLVDPRFAESRRNA